MSYVGLFFLREDTSQAADFSLFIQVEPLAVADCNLADWNLFDFILSIEFVRNKFDAMIALLYRFGVREKMLGSPQMQNAVYIAFSNSKSIISP